METQPIRRPPCGSLLIYPTHRCNLKCRHCYFAPIYDETIGRREDEVSGELLRGAIDALLPFGLRLCKFSGGEPFLRDDLMDLCRYADSKGLSIVIESNGTLITERHAAILGQLRKGVTVSVSVDGAEAQSHEALRGVPGCFRRTIDGVRHLVRAGVRVQIIAAAYQGNKDEMFGIVDMAAALRARSFKACFVRGVGRGRNVPLLSCKESIDLDEQLATYAKAAHVRYYTSLPISVRSAADIVRLRALRDRCGVTCTLGILGDGIISICGMGHYTKDFHFGKLGRDDIADVWLNHPTLKTIRECIPSRLRGTCGRCIARSACRGYCRMENEYVTLNSFFEAYPVCAEAERLGLIAPTRIFERPAASSPGRATPAPA